MPLKRAVIFRHLASLLNHNEKCSFLSDLIKQQPELLITSLFNHFKSELSEANIGGREYREEMGEYLKGG